MRVIVPDTMDLNKDGKTTVSELAVSALLIFVALVILFSAIIGVISWAALWKGLRYIVAASVFLTALIMLWRMIRYERQDWKDKTDREFERAKREYEFELAKGISQETGASSTDQARIDAAARMILIRYYGGHEWSRDAMVKQGLLTADLWNAANALLQSRGIRRERRTRLEPDTLDAAWGRYVDGMNKANRHRMNGANSDWQEAV